MSDLETILDSIYFPEYLSDPRRVEVDYAEWKRRYRPVPTNPATTGGYHE